MIKKTINDELSRHPEQRQAELVSGLFQPRQLAGSRREISASIAIRERLVWNRHF